MGKTAYLVLENGTVFKGEQFGFEGETTGEVVFNTAMTGYVKTLTDSTNFGQIIIQTFPQIGNYGIIREDFESDRVACKGYIVREWCQSPSNFRSDGEIDSLLKQYGVVGLKGVDTRALTRLVRTQGCMNGCITLDPDSVDQEALRANTLEDAISSCSTAQQYRLQASEASYEVAVLDLGVNKSILNQLIQLGCNVTVYPYDTPPEDILQAKPDGILLSNGPGDPSLQADLIARVQQLALSKTATLGVGLGHLLLALASGFKTSKMTFGHRGGNQPVKDNATGRVVITSQNHGYVVDGDSVLRLKAREAYVNINDLTNEGLEYKVIPALTVQFSPDKDVYNRFISLMNRRNG